MVRIDMSWDEIKRRAKNGASLAVLADLNGVNNDTMKKAIAALEKETGEKCVFEKIKKPKKKLLKPRVDKHKVLELANQGKKVSEIATICGCTTPPVYKILKEWRAEHPQEEAPVVAKKIVVSVEPEKLPKIQPQMIEIDAGVADVIETNIDDLRDLIQKKLDEIEMLKYQLRSWEDILKICVINPDTIKASDDLTISRSRSI